MKQYKAILIDWDQTIGDWETAEYNALRDLYANHYLQEWFDSFEQYFAIYKERNTALWLQYGNGEICKEYLHRERFLYPLLHILNLPFAPQPMIALADTMGTEFLALTNHYFCLMPDAKEVVTRLADKYPLTIVSNGFGEVQYYKIQHSELQSCFRHIIISEEIGINKPQPGIYLEALRRNGVAPDEAVMIGDSFSSDIQGAQSAGIDQIWITYGHPHPDEQTATYEVTALADVLNIL
ncbi:MAG: YjjG family noncanonical pyrimidine nucleotidase [Paludibacteraceae bacterium]|nr:YjjG family noncanonical pyrimidine nucleotidase [Paludibacteraceae bacterium]